MFITLGIATWLALFADKNPSNAISEPSRLSAGSNSKSKQLPTERGQNKNNSIHTVIERRYLIGKSGIDTTTPRNESLFSVQSWIVPPSDAVKTTQPLPTAPPLPFTYLGKKLQGEIWEIYLAVGDQTFIAREKYILNGTYRVDQIHSQTMNFTYLPLQQTQTLSIGASD